MTRNTCLLSNLSILLFFSGLLLSGQVFSQIDRTRQVQVPGLQQPVEILKDRWGISHIYAETEHDLFFAQGYSAARDRLFQFEIWRAQATGTTAEMLGPRMVDRDHGTRLFQFRGDLDRELSHYHPRGAAIINAFVDGVNAYIDEALAKPDALPLPFRILGIELGLRAAGLQARPDPAPPCQCGG